RRRPNRSCPLWQRSSDVMDCGSTGGGAALAPVSRGKGSPIRMIWQDWAAVDRPPARGRQPWRRHLAPASHGSAAGNPLSVLRARQSSRAPTACLGQPQRRGCTTRRLELGAVPVPVVRDPVLSIGSTFAGSYEVL